MINAYDITTKIIHLSFLVYASPQFVLKNAEMFMDENI